MIRKVSASTDIGKTLRKVGSPTSRLRDLGDVVELIKANELPRGYDLAPFVVDRYIEVWDGLEAERLR